MYAGLRPDRVNEFRQTETMEGVLFRLKENSHRFPLVPVVQVGIRESAFDESPEHDSASGTESTSRKDEARDLTCRSFVAQKDYPLASKERIE